MVARASHLSEHLKAEDINYQGICICFQIVTLVQPLERAVKVNLNPAGGGGDILSVVLGAPTFHEAHPRRKSVEKASRRTTKYEEVQRMTRE